MSKINDLTLQEIATFYGCSIRTAQDRVKEIKSYFGITRKGKILKLHLAHYENISCKDIDMILQCD